MKRILLIEDDLVMRESTAELLALAGFTIHTAKNGKEGVSQAKELCPDIIICDIMMPELDGYGVLHMLSRDLLTSAIPFIFLTANTERGDVRKGMELGADDYLTKPFDETELLNAIEMRLNKVELFKNKFSRSLEGLDQFLDNARGLKELEELSANERVVEYKKKQIVFHEGDTPQYLYYLSKGKVKVYKSHDCGKEYVTKVFTDGDFFGLSPLFDNKSYNDSAIILEDSEIRKISKKDFLSLVYKNRDVAVEFMKVLSRNVCENEQLLLSLAYNTVRKRTAEALVSLDAQYTLGDDLLTEIAVTREDLAGMAGTTTETVIRCLRDFKEHKFIEFNGRLTVILNLEGLRQVQH
jgi:CRP-like cAMP-binding protein